ncbi:MAG: OadG family protein [Sulfurovum sp.]|nr:OadG family protein [Sulfurovum sp.]
MEDVNLIGESIKFMVLGMAVVFAFLFILIQAIKLQAKIIEKYFPEETSAAPTPSGQSDESQRIAAIIAAVTEFRKK